MSNYKGHCKFNTLLALPILLVGSYYWLHPKWGLALTFSLCFLYGTFYMSPDLDLAKQIKLFSVRGVLTLPFRSYSRCFNHRGLSHSLFFGTITRLVWISLWGFAIYFLIYRVLPSTAPVIESFSANKWFFIYGLIGLFAADFSHIVLDKMTS